MMNDAAIAKLAASIYLLILFLSSPIFSWAIPFTLSSLPSPCNESLFVALPI
ncbi:hypothetical protein ABEW34_01000 [Paenibacillus algorifonticola]|uniref:hypothetical protein n=1 Tax=Paenibacillus algorifonticola TaxID=684063 RepID=UPI003D29CFD6